MDLTSILGNLRTITGAAQAVAGPLAAIGVPGAGLINVALEVANNLQQRMEDGGVVATSDNRAEVKAIIERLQAANDQLNAEIEKS